MDERAQVAVEYLLTVLFAVMLVIVVSAIALQISSMSDTATAEVVDNRNDAVSSLLG
ncbi:MAG: hypothetical protein NUV67_03960 [archaeon]|nr:hypothetical protein [archaeon]